MYWSNSANDKKTQRAISEITTDSYATELPLKNRTEAILPKTVGLLPTISNFAKKTISDMKTTSVALGVYFDNFITKL